MVCGRECAGNEIETEPAFLAALDPSILLHGTQHAKLAWSCSGSRLVESVEILSPIALFQGRWMELDLRDAVLAGATS